MMWQQYPINKSDVTGILGILRFPVCRVIEGKERTSLQVF